MDPDGFYKNLEELVESKDKAAQATALRGLLGRKHGTEMWLKMKQAVGGEESKQQLLRRYVQHGTVKSFVDERYDCAAPAATTRRRVKLDKGEIEAAPLNTFFYPSSPSVPLFSRRYATTTVEAVAVDPLQSASSIKSLNIPNVPVSTALFNPTSSASPGGAYKVGHAGIEEDIHRRTNLFMCLDDPQKKYPKRNLSYPLPPVSGVFSKNVLAIRDGETSGYAFLETPFTVDVVSSAYMEGATGVNIKRSTSVALTEKLRTAFGICARHNCKWLVIPVTSCHLARRVHEVLLEESFRNLFYRVTFATGSGPEGRQLAETVAGALGVPLSDERSFPQVLFANGSAAAQAALKRPLDVVLGTADSGSAKRRRPDAAAGERRETIVLDDDEREKAEPAETPQQRYAAVLASGIATSTEKDARINIRKRFVDALSLGRCQGSSVSDLKMVAKAVAIEEALHLHFGKVSVPGYRSQFRMLLMNMQDKNNDLLREQILDGSIAASALPTIKAAELRNPEKKAQAQAIISEITADMSAVHTSSTETSMYTCGRCRGRHCSYYELQTRSGDEPMTQFI
eukprot:gene15233-23266_t